MELKSLFVISMFSGISVLKNDTEAEDIELKIHAQTSHQQFKSNSICIEPR